jgi:hypothetical protein
VARLHPLTTAATGDVGDLVLTVYREMDEELELYDALNGLGDSIGDAIAARRRPAAE